MNTTKRIQALAAELAKDYQYNSIEFIEGELNDLKNALLKGNYYTNVESVSRSGMSRVIAIGWIKNNRFVSASDFVYKLAGCDVNGRIGGCGMDMLFAAQYNLFQYVCDQKRTPYQSHMKRYNDK